MVLGVGNREQPTVELKVKDMHWLLPPKEENPWIQSPALQHERLGMVLNPRPKPSVPYSLLRVPF